MATTLNEPGTTPTFRLPNHLGTQLAAAAQSLHHNSALIRTVVKDKDRTDPKTERAINAANACTHAGELVYRIRTVLEDPIEPEIWRDDFLDSLGGLFDALNDYHKTR